MWPSVKKFVIPGFILVVLGFILMKTMSYRAYMRHQPPTEYLRLVQGKVKDMSILQSRMKLHEPKKTAQIVQTRQPDFSEENVNSGQIQRNMYNILNKSRASLPDNTVNLRPVPGPTESDRRSKLSPDRSRAIMDVQTIADGPVNDDLVSNSELPPEDRWMEGKCRVGRNLAREKAWLEKLGADNPQSTKIKEMLSHAWSNYKKYAWGENELAPQSKSGISGVFPNEMGLTIVDSLDTLWLTGMFEEVAEGKDWIEKNLLNRFHDVHVSLFEFHIRFVGGLLSMYSLTNECLYLKLAKHCADLVSKSFISTSGIPSRSVRLKLSDEITTFADDTVVLSEIGTLHLEFIYLSNITGDPSYKNRVDKLRQALASSRVDGLYSNTVQVNTQSHFNSQDMTVSLGAMGDSFYEYLIKSHIQSNGRDENAKLLYFQAMQAIEQAGMLKTSSAGHKYYGNLQYGQIRPRMEHLTCFIGGTIALSAPYSVNPTETLKLGGDITETCHLSYMNTPTGLGPEAFRFDHGSEATSGRGEPTAYFLRPETVESYYSLYKVTKDIKYREWAWQMVESLEKYCRLESGYSGLRDVTTVQYHYWDNQQQSFFLAETLKYLFLIFKDEDLLPVTEWVFNTEAHPLPVLQ